MRVSDEPRVDNITLELGDTDRFEASEKDAALFSTTASFQRELPPNELSINYTIYYNAHVLMYS